jgi:hypothetical protein
MRTQKKNYVVPLGAAAPSHVVSFDHFSRRKQTTDSLDNLDVYFGLFHWRCPESAKDAQAICMFDFFHV